MELSELITNLQSENINIYIKPNYKKYYNTFPHIIRFNHAYSAFRDHRLIRTLTENTIKLISSKLSKKEFRTRYEVSTLSVYCVDLPSVIESIHPSLLKEWTDIEVGLMTEQVQEGSNIKPNLPKAQTTIVKQLPHNEWRYRVHWPSNYIRTKNDNSEALSAIIDQINNDPNTKHFDEDRTIQIKTGRHWGTTYFYTNSLDLFSIIALIDARFIKKIEKFVTLEELNEKTSG